MFTCSSCGYEANPDSAVACSLCGTKKAGAGGSTIKTAPKPIDDDELASAAKAVAESAEVATPSPARASGKGGKPKGGPVQETHTGILRMPEQPPEIANSATVLGAFIGTLVGYGFSWSHAGHAPAGFMELLPVAAAAIVLALVARFALTSMLEMRLTFSGREMFAGPVAAGIGAGFLIFTIFAFWQGSKVAGIEAAVEGGTANGAVGTNGRSLAEHVALLTPWSVKLKNDKHVVLAKAGGGTLDIPTGALTAENVRDIQKAMNVPAAELERLASDEPCPMGMRLPESFSLERFLEQLGPIYGVQKDTPAKPSPGKIYLTRRRPNGSEEALTLSDHPSTVGDLGSGLPRGVKLWIAVYLGMPARANAPVDHEQFVNEVLDKYGPSN